METGHNFNVQQKGNDWASGNCYNDVFPHHVVYVSALGYVICRVVGCMHFCQANSYLCLARCRYSMNVCWLNEQMNVDTNEIEFLLLLINWWKRRDVTFFAVQRPAVPFVMKTYFRFKHLLFQKNIFVGRITSSSM